jgi:putative ABC transport system permease protein
MEWLGQPRSYNELDIVAADNNQDFEHVRSVAETVRDKVERSGRRVFFLFVPEPGRHPLDSIVDTVLMLLGSLGGLAVVLSGFLVVNTVVALLAHQTRHIGIMKSVGARRGQIGGMYLVTVLGYGALSILVALPLGALGAFGLANFMAGKLNVDLPPGGFPRSVILAQVAVALAVPVIAAAAPVLSGTRITVREALSSYGLGKGHFGESRIDRALRRVTHLPRPTLLSLRNTFRRKFRLLLTLVTLTLAGAAFIAVFAVRASMLRTLDHVLDLWQYHVLVAVDQPYRTDRLVEEALSTPGVKAAEGWGFGAVRFLHADDTESEAVFVFAAPADTKLLVPDVIRGRWLADGDENAIVLNTKAQQEAKDANIGDVVTLRIEGKDRPFQVAGIVKSPGPDAMAYMNYPYFGQITGSVGRATSVLVVAKDASDAGQKRVAVDLERHFKESGLRVTSVLRIASEIEEAEASFNILVVLLLIMAILLAAVGGLGLAGAMSLNVIERTREIGVMRAIGADRRHIMSIVLTEGLVIGFVSAVFGAFLAVPLGRALSDAVGTTFMSSALLFTYPWQGLVLWFAVALTVAAVASALPAWNAARMSVREALAYE